MNIFDAAKLDAGKTLKLCETSIHGLLAKEAHKRLNQYGRNVFEEEKKVNSVMGLLKQFANPLVLILLAAAIISTFFGENLNAIIVVIIVVISTLLNFFQERKADHAAQKLKDRLRTTATVMRDGKKVELGIQHICPGDIILLNAGDLVPADARVILAKDFFVNQSALTGESFPVEKSSESVTTPGLSLSDLNNIVFSGTNVVTGTATVVVVATGKSTEFGKIAHRLLQPEQSSEFIQGINSFSHLVLKMTLLIVLAIFFFNMLLKKDVLESFLFAVAIAVGLTPELLPMILSVTMGRGSLKMAQKGVIVKNLVAIPNFGSMDVLCTDKTGTLTQDRIALVKYTNVDGHDSEDVLLHAYLNSFYQTGISNPMDEAVKNYKHLSLSHYKKIDEVPFDFLRKRMSVVVEKADERVLICKGAPEEVFAQCSLYRLNQKDIPFHPEHKNAATRVYHDMSADGYRVVAIATKTLHDHRASYDVKDECELILLGFIAFLDPPKAHMKQVVQSLERSGVTIKIITGDNELVTKRVCTELEIPVRGVVLGHEIDGLTDDALRVKVEKNTIFARFSPDEKNRIIRMLRLNGHVVGYMGDGINDAPSLKTADVGISVENAVDVAKESADIILTDKSLQVLLDGILEGRKTFGNSMKYVMMGISSNFGNMLSVIGAVLTLPFFPMIPIQILLNNLLYDFSQITLPGDNVDAEYISSPKRWDMKFVKKFMVTFGLLSSCFDFITFFVLFKIFGVEAAAFQTGWFLQSLTTQTFIIHVIRTRKTPFLQSRASTGLLVSTFVICVIGWILPFTSLGKIFGFVPLSLPIIASLGCIVVAYLLTVEVVKKVFYRIVSPEINH